MWKICKSLLQESLISELNAWTKTNSKALPNCCTNGKNNVLPSIILRLSAVCDIYYLLFLINSPSNEFIWQITSIVIIIIIIVIIIFISIFEVNTVHIIEKIDSRLEKIRTYLSKTCQNSTTENRLLHLLLLQLCDVDSWT